MLPEALTALSAAGGAAVVRAAGTDAWTAFRDRLARWFGRGDAGREREELERLDRTAAAVIGADEGGEAERLRIRHEAAWQTRIETVLEGLAVRERYGVANALLDFLPLDQRDEHAERLVAEAQRVMAPGGFAAGGDVTIHAEGDSSVAAGVIHGGVTINNSLDTLFRRLGPPTPQQDDQPRRRSGGGGVPDDP